MLKYQLIMQIMVHSQADSHLDNNGGSNDYLNNGQLCIWARIQIVMRDRMVIQIMVRSLFGLAFRYIEFG